MGFELVYDPVMTGYRFPAGHPMRPERFSLAVELARAWGLLESALIAVPTAARDEDLLLVHSADYVRHVKTASHDPARADLAFGLGPGDTPAFPGMHEAAALAVGASIEALEAVLDSRASRSFSPASGLHHAQRERASGFCIYNDCAIAIARATLERPGLRVAYVDIDAHHGDGVQAAFLKRADVLTVSVHESGRFLFPGTGTRVREGEGDGEGLAVNVPLLPESGDAEYAEAIETVVLPAVREFGPDVIFAQLGADSHASDPLTHLRVSVDGYVRCVRQLVELADEVCGGRIAATGGGGYQPYCEVPVMWASAIAVLSGAEVPDSVPEEWKNLAAQAAAHAL